MTGQVLPQRKHLFQPFVRGDSARKAPAGTGLGLAIVQRIIDNHNECWRLAPASVAACHPRPATGSRVASVDDKEGIRAGGINSPFLLNAG